MSSIFIYNSGMRHSLVTAISISQRIYKPYDTCVCSVGRRKVTCSPTKHRKCRFVSHKSHTYNHGIVPGPLQWEAAQPEIWHSQNSDFLIQAVAQM